MSNNTNPEINFTILENGLDFIETALLHLEGDPKPRDLKYAVLHLSAGVELILKDRLRREHWTLVFNDANKADLDAYSSSDFFSVDLKSAIQRLINICDIDMLESAKPSFLALKKRRNRLEHFATIDSVAAIKASTAKVLGFTIDFISNEFSLEDLDENETTLLSNVRELLPEFDKFVEERNKEIEEELTSEDLTVEVCPRCIQDALVIDDGANCKFCGYSAEGNDAAQDYVFSLFGLDWKHVADGGEIPIYSCPECGIESLIDVGNLTHEFDSDRFVCFACGNSWAWDSMDFCSRCGSPVACNMEDGLPVCKQCWP